MDVKNWMKTKNQMKDKTNEDMDKHSLTHTSKMDHKAGKFLR